MPSNTPFVSEKTEAFLPGDSYLSFPKFSLFISNFVVQFRTDRFDASNTFEERLEQEKLCTQHGILDLFEFSLNVFIAFSEFTDKNIILKRFLYSNPLSPMRETETLPLWRRDTADRELLDS